jgi:putative ABC transport system permease protein
MTRFTTAIVLILACAVAATTVLGTLFVAVLGDVPPINRPEEVARVRIADATTPSGLRQPTVVEFAAWRGASRTLDALTAVASRTALLGSVNASSARVQSVTSDYFRLAGRVPRIGRPFSPADAGARVAIVGDRLWRSTLAASPSPIGATITLDAEPYIVVGVMPADFWLPARDVDLWEPLAFGEADAVDVFGRLTSGRSWADAQSELDVVTRTKTIVRPLPQEAKQKLGPGLLALVAPGVAILLVACANVGNLLLIRVFDRRRELAIRAALGATPWQLARMSIAEVTRLTVVAAIAGAALAWWGTQGLRLAGGGPLPALASAVGPGVVAGIASAAALAAFAALAPIAAIYAGRVGADDLHAGARRSIIWRGARYGAGDLFIVVQVALAVVLVLVSAFDLRLFSEAVRMDRPPAGDRVLAMRISAGQNVAAPARAVAFDALADQVRRSAGVGAAAIATSLPQRGAPRTHVETRTDGGTGTCSLKVSTVTPEFFDVLGLRVREGAPARGAAVVSESAAASCFPSGLRQNPHVRVVANGPWMPIAAVAADPFSSRMSGTADAASYVWVVVTGEWPSSAFVIAVMAAPGLERPALHAVAGVAFDAWTTYGERTGTNAGEMLLIVGLLASMSLLALLMAVVGVYAALRQTCSSQLPELGIRLALGARPAGVALHALARDLPLVAAGLLTGAVGTVWVTAYVWRDLLMLSALDPGVWFGVGAVMSAAGAVASLGPALRAARVDPVVVLRAE